MILLAFALLCAGEGQAVAPPPPTGRAAPQTPEFHLVTAADGSTALLVPRAAAEGRDALEDAMEAEAAKHCGSQKLELGEFAYNQASDSDGNPAAEMTDIRQNFRCVDLQPVGAVK